MCIYNDRPLCTSEVYTSTSIAARCRGLEYLSLKFKPSARYRYKMFLLTLHSLRGIYMNGVLALLITWTQNSETNQTDLAQSPCLYKGATCKETESLLPVLLPVPALYFKLNFKPRATSSIHCSTSDAVKARRLHNSKKTHCRCKNRLSFKSQYKAPI